MIEVNEKNQKFSVKIWKKLFPFFKPYKRNLIVLIIFMIICSAIDIVFPLFQQYAIDNFIVEGTTKNIGIFAGTYVFLIAFQSFCVITFCRNSTIIEQNLSKDLRRATFVHLQELSFSYYNQTPVGYIMARTTSDTARIGGLIAWGLQDILWALFYVVGVFFAMFLLNAQLALLVLAVVPFIAVVTVFFQTKILHQNRKVRKINSLMTGAYNEGITGARTAKTLNIEEKSTDEFKEVSGRLYNHTMKATMLSAVYIPIILFFTSIAVALVLYKGGYLVMDNVIEIGLLSAFVSYAVGIFEPIQQIARVIADFISAQVNIERVSDLLETKPQITDTAEVIEKYGDSFHPKLENFEPIKGDITFDDVTFMYPDGKENVLEHFSLKVNAGMTVAIVGETGAGKSTLVNLACRFFEPTGGRILIDGIDYKERSQLWLHSNIGYVLQNPHLFSGTIKDNIRYGRLDATDEEIVNAAKIVSAHDIIMGMENGYESEVGESGDRLSTGEKQLISFARAVIADPKIFVLDEATSSIDTKTEQLIQNAISHLLTNRTSFLIAHRLSTIRKADLILVVKDGKIIEQGTHHELLSNHGYYFDLYRKQFEEESSDELWNSPKN